MKRFMLVAWLMSGTISAAAQEVPRHIVPFKPPDVDAKISYFDSTGKFIGVLVGGSIASPELLFFYNGTDTFSLFLSAPSGNPMKWIHAGQIGFTEPGCVGQALLLDTGFATKRLAAIAPWDNTLYLSRPNPVLQSFLMASVRQTGDCEDLSSPSTYMLFPVKPVVNLDSIYALPFHMDRGHRLVRRRSASQ